MAALDELKKRLLTEIAVSLSDLFDRSFETKSFDGKPWKPRKIETGTGSLMLNTGTLRRSLKHEIQGNAVAWFSNVPYAKIHNEGGYIAVTERMKKFFWAMYYKYHKRVRIGKTKKNKGQFLGKSEMYNATAEAYKHLALMKIGAKIKIPQRQFIGDSRDVRVRVEKITQKYVERLLEAVMKNAARK